jgi:hypothetical protein
MREIVRQMVAERGWEGEFEQAVETGWRGLWDLGMAAAKSLSPMNKPNCAYCFLMNIAALNRWDSETSERMRRNLAVLRDNSATT